MTNKQKQSLALELAKSEPKVRAIYVATYIPRECGIATYTKDLTNAINLLNPRCLADIVAIDDEKEVGKKRNYPWEVKFKIEQEKMHSWMDAAEYINQSGAEVVSIQHEFGIYGGMRGEYIIPFLDSIKKPIVLTFHTVVPRPDDNVKELVRRITERASGIIVMVQTAVERLVKTYGVDRNKIVVIHHGVPDITYGSTDAAKAELGLTGSLTISSFGLFSRGKGYELAINALPRIVAKHPNTKLLLLGETHPVVKRRDGEEYRDSLVKLVKELKLENNVEFVNRYLTLEEIVDYLKATDVYLTPYPNLDQITSGTLAYAIGAGKACVSTPYLYAQEVLGEGRGILVKPNSPEEIAVAINQLFDQPAQREKIARSAYQYGRNMIWPAVALKHLDLFDILRENHGSS